MSLTKLSYSMIQGEGKNVFDFLSDAEIADVSSNAATIDITLKVQAAINSLPNGGTLYFPSGVYNVTNLIVSNVQQLILQGSATTTIFFNGADDSWGLTVESFGVFRSIAIRDMNFAGPSGTVTKNGIDTRLLLNCEFRNLDFRHLKTCFRGRDLYGSTFDNIKFRDYEIGIRGMTVAEAAALGYDNNVSNPIADNTFNNLYFFDASSIPTYTFALQDHDFNSNHFFGCTFAGGSLNGIDLTNGYGGNTFVGCRFERMKPGVPWINLNSFNYLYDCVIYTDGVKISYPSFMIDIYGDGNYIDGISPEYAWRIVKLRAGSKNNDITWIPGHSNVWLANTPSRLPIYDQGTNNLIKIGANDFMSGRDQAWSTRKLYNLFTDSVDQSSFSVDGLVKSSTPTAINGGPYGVGYVYTYDTPTGNRRALASITGLAVGYYYMYSMWIASPAAATLGEIDLIIGHDMANASSFQAIPVMPGDNTWYRVYGFFKATDTSMFCGFRMPSGAGQLCVFGPQFVECGNSPSLICVGGFIPTSGGGRLELSPNFANNPKLPGIPNGGRHWVGEFVENLTPTVSGTAGSKYVVDGWKRLTNGTLNNVLNTDWVEVRTLTGT